MDREVMHRRYDLWDQYFANTIPDWNLWEEWDEQWIKDVLDDDENVEYTDDDVEYLLDQAKEAQEEMRSEAKQEDMENLEGEINDVLERSYDHLSCDDIGKVLVKIAASYFEDTTCLYFRSRRRKRFFKTKNR